MSFEELPVQLHFDSKLIGYGTGTLCKKIISVDILAKPRTPTLEIEVKDI